MFLAFSQSGRRLVEGGTQKQVIGSGRFVCCFSSNSDVLTIYASSLIILRETIELYE